jgi:hypothetical protein
VILITTISSTISKYKSNIDYATATELEYGQVVNQLSNLPKRV